MVPRPQIEDLKKTNTEQTMTRVMLFALGTDGQPHPVNLDPDTGGISGGGSSTGVTSVSAGDGMDVAPATGAVVVSFDPANLTTTPAARGDLVPFADASDASNPKNTAISNIAGLTNPAIFNARLTLTSNTPVTTSDVTAATTLYLTPYLGNKIAIYDLTKWIQYDLTEISINTSGLSANTNYDVGVYDNAGTLALTLYPWASATGRNTPLVLQDNVYAFTSATNVRYCGTIRTTAATQFEDSLKSRLVINFYNETQRKLRAHDAANAWTSTNNGFQNWNGGTTLGTARVEALFPSPGGDDLCYLDFLAGGSSDNSTYFAIGIGLDNNSATAATNHATQITGAQGLNIIGAMEARYFAPPGLGYHYFQMLQRPGAFGTTSFYGDANTIYLFSAMEGYVWG